jgi:hypothetical protein
MPPIFINTDNSDKTDKVFIGTLAGPAMTVVEEKMRAMVVKAIEKAPEFTTNKIDNPKGYTLMFKLTKFAAEGREASCTITGEILRYPKVGYSKAKEAGKAQTETVMFGGEWKGSASASGRSAAADCIEAIMESMIPKSYPVMKSDMTRR